MRGLRPKQVVIVKADFKEHCRTCWRRFVKLLKTPIW